MRPHLTEGREGHAKGGLFAPDTEERSCAGRRRIPAGNGYQTVHVLEPVVLSVLVSENGRATFRLDRLALAKGDWARKNDGTAYKSGSRQL